MQFDLLRWWLGETVRIIYFRLLTEGWGGRGGGGGGGGGCDVAVYIYPIVWSWSDCFPPPQV